jgi:ABC-2 type transport system permease protein
MTASASATPMRRRAPFREFWGTVATIMDKELRSRFRGRRAFVVLTIYLAVLALIAYGAYSVEAPVARQDAQLGGFLGQFGAPNASARVGQAIFTVLSLFQLLLVCFIAPAFTAGAISLEREKQTFDMLIATPMRPGGLVVGKLLSALAFVILMVLAGIPISALVLMYGGASLDDILRQQVVLLVSAIGCGVIGLFYSALMKRTQTATVLTYTTLIALAIGTLLVWRFWTSVATTDPQNAFGEVRTAPEALLYVNPAVAMIEILANTELGYGDFSKILDQLGGSTADVICDGERCLPTDPVTLREVELARAEQVRGAPDDAFELAVPTLLPTDDQVSNHFWPRISVTMGGISVLLTLIAMRLVVPVGMRWRFRPRRRAIAPAAAPSPPDPAVDEHLA